MSCCTPRRFTRKQCEPLPDGVQVDSHGKKLMSLNFMNQEVFVKV